MPNYALYDHLLKDEESPENEKTQQDPPAEARGRQANYEVTKGVYCVMFVSMLANIILGILYLRSRNGLGGQADGRSLWGKSPTLSFLPLENSPWPHQSGYMKDEIFANAHSSASIQRCPATYVPSNRIRARYQL
jgi:hypothetical protein